MLRTGLGFGLLRGLRSHGLIDLKERHLQLAEKIEEERVFLGGKIAFGLFVQCVEHIDELARRFRIEHRLTGAWIGVGAQDHCGITAQHADEVFKSGRTLGGFRRRSCRGFGGLSRRREWMPGGLALGFALFLFDNFLAQFSFGGEGTAVDDAKSLFLFVIGLLVVRQVRSSVVLWFLILALGVLVWVAGGGLEKKRLTRRYACRNACRDCRVKRLLGPEFFGRKMASRKTRLNKSKSRSTASGKGSRKPPRKAPKQKKLTAGEWFERLVALQARLRARNGCPWDREQTHATLRTYLIEEAYEVVAAMNSGDDAKFANEMGDLLLQVVFHSQIATEEERFTVADVIREVHEKMVRRHPHVFGEKRARDAAEVLRNWEQIKAQERRGAEERQEHGDVEKKEQRKSLLDGVPRGLPATMEGLQLTRKASRAGFDWESAQGVFEKLREEIDELHH